jgi:diaminopimelate decarboxylase
LAVAPPADATNVLPPDVVPPNVAGLLRRLANDDAAPVSTYVYCPESAAERAASLRDALPEWAEIFYAVKANSFPPVLGALARFVDGFEVASEREAELAVGAWSEIDGRARLIASGPGKSKPTLAALMRLGVEVINVESALELHRVAHLANMIGRQVQVALRVHPPAVRITRSLHIGAAATPFGIAVRDIPEALRVAAGLSNLNVVGFHFHTVCNNLDAEAHADYVRWCLEWSTRTARVHDVDLRLVDVGGGIGVDDDVARFELDAFGRALRQLRTPNDVRVLFEPGRWLVHDCGYYAAEVTDVKHTNGTSFAVLRGGIHQFMRPAAYGTTHNFTVIPISKWTLTAPRPEVRAAPVTVVGELCTPADVLARDVTVDRIRPGDVVVFPGAGSYGWEMSLQEFLGHPHAGRVTVEGGCE